MPNVSFSDYFKMRFGHFKQVCTYFYPHPLEKRKARGAERALPAPRKTLVSSQGMPYTVDYYCIFCIWGRLIKDKVVKNAHYGTVFVLV